MMPNLENLQILETQLQTSFQAGLARADFDYLVLATQVPSTTDIETYGWLKNFPRIREWLGKRLVKGVSGQAYTLRNKEWELTIGIPRREIEDDKYGMYKPIAESMGNEVGLHKTELVIDALEQGHVNLCFDGKPFFAPDHPVGEGTKSNITDGASAPWYVIDDSRPLKPIIFQMRREPELISYNKVNDRNMFFDKEAIWGLDGRYACGYGLWQTAHRSKATLDEAGFAAVRQKMRELTDDDGRKLNVSPKLLVVGPSNELAAEKLIDQIVKANGEANVMKGKVRYMVSNFLQ